MGIRIIIDVDQLKEYKLMPTEFVMLYFLNSKLDCKISPQTRMTLFKMEYIDKEGNITNLGKSLFTGFDVITPEVKDKLKLVLEKMLEHFPKGIKTGGKPVRSSINSDLIQKLRNFKKEYSYDDTVIIEAAKKYSEDRKKDNYNYMRVFKYFINKQGQGSDLADYCEMIINGDDKTNGRNTKTL